jgi:hypothetical protein
MEVALEPLAASVAAGSIDAEAFRAAQRSCIAHYQHEESFVERLSAHDAALAAKLRGQHTEALELAERLEEALAADHARDAIYLARRFLAIVQHNIIEEERDVFPTVE